MKIKAIPIKSRTLCEKCYFFVFGEHCTNTHCRVCENHGESQCHCTEIVVGEPCRHFKRKESTFPKITTHGFFVDKCKCGGNVAVQFGFSCTGKPMSTLSCDNCKKIVHVIGNLKHGQKFMDIWEGADNGK